MKLGLILLSLILSINGSVLNIESINGGTELFVDKGENALASQEKDETTQIVDLIREYEGHISIAVNDNKFSLLEPYLKSKSPAYNSQKKLVADIRKNGVRYKGVSHELGFLFYDGDRTYRAEVVETITSIKPGNKEVNQDFQWIYTIEKTADGFKISRIEQWKSYKKDVEFREMNVKSDGFYLYPIYEGYDYSLVELLNKQQPNQLDWLFKDSEVSAKHEAMVEGLRLKGKDFSLVKSEYIEHWNSSPSPYTAKKKITISYVGNDSSRKEMNLYLTLVIEVSRLKGKIFTDVNTNIIRVEYVIE